MFNVPTLPAREGEGQRSAAGGLVQPAYGERGRARVDPAKLDPRASSMFTLPPLPAADKGRVEHRQAGVAGKWGG
eukprot:12830796-Alexandrium_andersonii.AAC.1